MKEPGQYRFRYPAEFTTLPEYTARAGRIVTVTGVSEAGEITTDEAAEAAGLEILYDITTKDGWTGVAFESELEPVESELEPGDCAKGEHVEVGPDGTCVHCGAHVW